MEKIEILKFLMSYESRQCTCTTASDSIAIQYKSRIIGRKKEVSEAIDFEGINTITSNSERPKDPTFFEI